MSFTPGQTLTAAELNELVPPLADLVGGTGTTFTIVNLGTSLALTSGTLDVTGAPPSGAAGGDLGSTYPNPTVLSIANVNTGTLGVAHGGTGLGAGTNGGILGFTASGVLASSGALTNHAIVLGGGAGATPTALGSLGTSTTVLHGNAAGAPTFAAVNLAADVTGLLPFANLATVAATSLLGNATGAGASAANIAIGANLSLAGSPGTLSASAGASLIVTDTTTTVNPTGTLTIVGGTVSDLGGGDAEVTVTGGAGSVTKVVAEGGPFLTSGTITTAGTITNSSASLATHGILLGEGTGAVVATAAMTDGQLLIGATSADPAPQTMSGDATITKLGAITLKNSGVTAAKYGDATHVPQITVDAQGRITLAADVAISGSSLNVGTVSSVTTLTAGTGITFSGSGGNATITSSGGGGIGTIVGAGVANTATSVAIPPPAFNVPAAAGFTFVNQNSATLTDNTNGPLVWRCQNATGSTTLSMVKKAAPAGSWTATWNAAYMLSSAQTFAAFGVTDGTKFGIFMMAPGATATPEVQMQMQQWTNSTTPSSTVVTKHIYVPNPLWVRVVYNSVTPSLTYQYSIDGFTWVTILAQTGGGMFLTPTDYCFGANIFQNDSLSPALISVNSLTVV